MKQFTICLLFSITIIGFLAEVRAIINLGDQCTTYENKIGTCTKLKVNCEEKIFTKRKHTRLEHRNVLKSSCGKAKEKAVCCTTTTSIRKLDKLDHLDNLQLLPNSTICGKTDENRIHGGNITGMSDYPWMALLKYRSFRVGTTAYKCGGSLINDRYVITATHCVSRSRLFEFMNEVRLGEWDLSSTKDCIHATCSDQPLDIGVEEIISHPNFPSRSPIVNDITLLRLATKVTFTDYIKPICLPIETEQLSRSYNEIELTVVGWGYTEENKMSNKKLYTKIKGTTTQNCDTVFGFTRTNKKLNNKTQLCVGGDGVHDSCMGDSGGPLMHRDLDAYIPNWTLIGIVSYGFQECAAKGKPAVYTRVDGFKTWILEHIHE